MKMILVPALYVYVHRWISRQMATGITDDVSAVLHIYYANLIPTSQAYAFRVPILVERGSYTGLSNSLSVGKIYRCGNCRQIDWSIDWLWNWNLSLRHCGNCRQMIGSQASTNTKVLASSLYYDRHDNDVVPQKILRLAVRWVQTKIEMSLFYLYFIYSFYYENNFF